MGTVKMRFEKANAVPRTFLLAKFWAKIQYLSARLQNPYE